MASKTRKHSKRNHRCLNKDAKKGTQLKALMKTCRANKYKSIYGSTGGNIRSNISMYN